MIRARALAPTLLAAALACAHAPARTAPAGPAPPAAPDPPASPPPPEPAVARGEQALLASARAERLSALRAQVDGLLAAEAHALWAAWTQGGAPELDGNAARFAAVFAPESLGLVAEARDAAQGDERRALSLLHAYLVGEQLARALPPGLPTPSPIVTWEARPVPAARVPSLLAAEPDPGRRAALERAWAEAERRELARAEARWAAVTAAARKLGYGSLAPLAAELRGAPIDALAALADGVLTGSEGTYCALLDALARVEMGKALADLRGRDLPRLFRAGEDGRTFPAARLAADAAAPFAGTGLRPEGAPAPVIDGEDRPGKDPRALALPVEVPGDVRVSFSPAAGGSSLRGLLHELGAAAFYVHVRSPVLEFRRLGAVTAEAWGHLFEALYGEPAWLAERTGLREGHVAPIVRAAAARRLHRARSLAARILCEVARQREPARAAEAGAAVLRRAMARPVEADELDIFLAERDPLLESADALRALLVAAQAQVHLAARAGPTWWRSPESGTVLAAAFGEGSRLPPEDLARSLGATALDGVALVAVSGTRATAAGVRLVEAAPARR